MDAIFMNSENNTTSKPRILMLKLNDKLDLRRSERLLPYEILVFITRGKS